MGMENLPTVKGYNNGKYGGEEEAQMGFKKRSHGFILRAFRKAVNLKARDRVLCERDGKSLFLPLLLSFLRNETQARIKLSSANSSSTPSQLRLTEADSVPST